MYGIYLTKSFNLSNIRFINNFTGVAKKVYLPYNNKINKESCMKKTKEMETKLSTSSGIAGCCTKRNDK